MENATRITEGMLDIEDLYALNDLVTAYAHGLGITWASEEEEDEALNEATHEIAAALERLFPSPPSRV